MKMNWNWLRIRRVGLAALATAAVAALPAPPAAHAAAPAVTTAAAPTAPRAAPVATPAAGQVHSRYATVNGVKLHYLVAGDGPPVVLLHGFGETSHMWLPLIAALAPRHLVIAPDLRGAGGSQKTAGGYDKKSMAQDVHALVASLGQRRVEVVGHDIGLMVAYAYAARYPDEVSRLVLMDAFLPGVGNWHDVWLARDLWHFHFYGKTPLALVTGRERIYLEHFWNDFAADPRHSVPEADRRLYAADFARPGAIQAGFEWFHAFEQDAQDNERFAATKLTMPVLAIGGEKASGSELLDQGRLVATDVKGIIVPGAGHWLMEEAPRIVIPDLVQFLDAGAADAR